MDCATTSAANEKIRDIEDCLSRGNVNIWKLRQLALTKGGFINSEMRMKVWPLLVGIDVDKINEKDRSSSSPSSSVGIGPAKITPTTTTSSSQHPIQQPYQIPLEEKTVIEQDLGRSAWHIEKEISRLRHNNTTTTTTTPQPTEHERNTTELSTLHHTITTILTTTPHTLHYFQGFHDIVALTLINLQNDTNLTSHLLHRLALSHLRDQMKASFAELQSALQLTIFPLLKKVDEEVEEWLVEGGGIDVPMFCLSWVLSWFCHDVLDVEVASRLLDVFFGSHPMMPLYMSVAILAIPTNREKILNAECSFPGGHYVLLNLPRDMVSSVQMARRGIDGGDVDIFEEVIDLTLTIMRQIPPRDLPTLARNYRDGHLIPILEEMSPSINLFQYDSNDHDTPSSSSSSKSKPRRRRSTTTTMKIPPQARKYPRAIIAAGLSDVSRQESRRRKRWIRRCLQSMTVIVVATVVSLRFVVTSSARDIGNDEGRVMMRETMTEKGRRGGDDDERGDREGRGGPASSPGRLKKFSSMYEGFV